MTDRSAKIIGGSLLAVPIAVIVVLLGAWCVAFGLLYGWTGWVVAVLTIGGALLLSAMVYAGASLYYSGPPTESSYKTDKN